MAPLTRLRSDNQIPYDEAIKHYGDRAAAAPGTLLISEATSIAPAAVGQYLAPGIWSKEQIAHWKKVTAKVHDGESFIYCQIWAHGRGAWESDLKKVNPSFEVVSASDVKAGGDEYVTPRPLTIPEIEQYVQWYAQAAKNALEAGFDGVEIHAANGYLIDQFLHEDVNHRTDEYGDSIGNRSRFPLEVVDAVVAAVGADKVGIRLNPWGGLLDMDYKISPLPQYTHVLSELERRAVEKASDRLAYIHVTDPRIDLGLGDAEGSYGNVYRTANAFVRQIWKGVIFRTGSFGKDVQLMEDLIAKDDKLILTVGRLFISNPDLVVKLRENTPVDMYDRHTFYWNNSTEFPLAVGYTVGYTRDYIKTAP